MCKDWEHNAGDQQKSLSVISPESASYCSDKCDFSWKTK